MARRLPSLNGLRAFEAAGRHGSFTAAANELNVTQTAVSRMVRLLEQRLGFALFRRHANTLELTAQGQTFLADSPIPSIRSHVFPNKLRRCGRVRC